MNIRLSLCTAVLMLGSIGLTVKADAPDISSKIVTGPAAVRIDRYLAWAEQFGFSGVALLALDGEIVLHKAYGPADRKHEIPNRLDTIFSFGSIAKQFTAAAVMKLEQEGKLRTEDPISKYLDGVPPDKQATTIHHLLTHTAGLIDYYGISDFQKMDRDTAVRGILKSRLLSPPGTEFSYSNPGFTLAAAIIEKVTGQEFVDFMQQEIFRPAGMTEAGFMGDDLWEPGRSAHIYRGARDNGAPSEKPGPYWVLLGNGGVVATVGQMYLWDRALRTDELLGPAAKQKIFTPYMNEYGYGWDVIATDRGTTMHSHNGGSSLGLSAEFQRYIDEDGALILASNASIGDSLAIDHMVRPLSKLVFEPGPALPEPPKLGPRDDEAARYEGLYELDGGGQFSIYTDAGQLFFAPVGQDALDFVDSRARPHTKEANALNARAAEIIAGVFGGNMQPLMSAFTKTDESTVRRTLRWSEMLKSSPPNNGRFQKVDVLGTTNLGQDGNTELVTWIRLHFNRGERVRRLHWQDGKLRGLGGDLWPYPFYGPLRFTSAGDGMVFHFPTSSAATVQFDADKDGTITGLALDVGSKKVHGRKIEAGN